MQNGLHCVWELLDQIPHFFDLLRIGSGYTEIDSFCDSNDWHAILLWQGNSSSSLITCPLFYIQDMLPWLLKPLFSYPEQSAWEREGERRRERWASRSLALFQSRTQQPWRRWRRTPARIKNDYGDNSKTFSREQKLTFLYCHHPLQVHHSCLQYTHRKANTMITCWRKIKIFTWTLIVSVSPL